MKKTLTILFMLVVIQLSAQMPFNNQIRYLAYVHEVSANDLDEDFASNEEFSVVLRWRDGDNGNQLGPNCYTFDGDEGGMTSVNGGHYITNRPYDDRFKILFQGWEDDEGNRCSADGGDDVYYESTFTSQILNNNDPSQWNSPVNSNASAWVAGYMVPSTSNWNMRVSYVWRFEHGQYREDPINYGLLENLGVVQVFHYNSSRQDPSVAASLQYSNEEGGSAPDVYYRFGTATGGLMEISTDLNDTDFDTMLYLYDESGNEIYSNDDAASGNLKSTIEEVLCPGTYTIRVTGFNGDAGKFGLLIRKAASLTNYIGLTTDITAASCDGATDGSVMMTVSEDPVGDVTYYLNDGNSTIEVSNPVTGLTVGNYTVSAVDECGRTGEQYITVIAEDNTPPEAVCDPNLVITLANAADSYEYSSNDFTIFTSLSSDNCGLVSAEIQPAVITAADAPSVIYTMTVFDAAGNSSSCSETILVNAPTTAVQDEKLNAALATYPNPVTNRLNIELKGVTIEEGQLYLRDNTGRVLQQLTIDRSANWSDSIDMSALPAGLYTIQLVTSNGQLTRRIVKQ